MIQIAPQYNLYYNSYERTIRELCTEQNQAKSNATASIYMWVRAGVELCRRQLLCVKNLAGKDILSLVLVNEKKKRSQYGTKH